MLNSGSIFFENALPPEAAMAESRAYLAKFFPEQTIKENSYQNFVSETIRQLTFGLPPEYNEILLTSFNLLFFWSFEGPLQRYFEEYLRVQKNEKGVFMDNHTEVKKYFQRWVIEKDPKEKEYFALSVFQLADRNYNRENFYKHIYTGLLYGTDRKFYAASKCDASLNEAKNLVAESQLDEDTKDLFLYYILITHSILHRMRGDTASSRSALKEADRYRTNPVNCYYHQALLALEPDAEPDINTAVKNVFKFDRTRLVYALHKNNFTLFGFLISNSITGLLTVAPELAGYTIMLRDIHLQGLSEDETFLSRLGVGIESVKKMGLDNYYEIKVISSLEFLEQVVSTYQSSPNLLLRSLEVDLTAKLKECVEQIKENIESTALERIRGDIEDFEKRIAEDRANLEFLKTEHNGERKNLDLQLQETVNLIENKSFQAIKKFEDRIKEIDQKQNVNPAKTFKNSLINTLVVSLIMIIIGGFVSSLSGDMNWSGSFAAVLRAFFLTGLIWGGSTFVLGFVISFLMASSTIYESTKEKREILKKITLVQNQKRKEIDQFKKEHEKKYSSRGKVAESRIKQAEEALRSSVEGKRQKEDTLMQEKEAATREPIQKLNTILTSLYRH